MPKNEYSIHSKFSIRQTNTFSVVNNTTTSSVTGQTGSGNASSATRALVNVILTGGYYARVTREEYNHLLEDCSIIAVEG